MQGNVLLALSFGSRRPAASALAAADQKPFRSELPDPYQPAAFRHVVPDILDFSGSIFLALLSSATIPGCGLYAPNIDGTRYALEKSRATHPYRYLVCS
jgi:hypothetical protein